MFHFVLLFLLLMHAQCEIPPWRVLKKLLNAFGEDIGGWLRHWLQIQKPLSTIAPLAPRACQLRHTCLVGAFHGHAHNRLCQLSHLATYVKGLGLEDLEGCERAFLKVQCTGGSPSICQHLPSKAGHSSIF